MAGNRSVGRPRQYDDDVERRLILDAAYEALRDHGQGFTIANILSTAGVSTRSFYRHFDSKDALLAAMYLRDGQWAADRLAKRLVDAGSPREALEWWIDEIFSFTGSPRRAERVSVLGSLTGLRADGADGAELLVVGCGFGFGGAVVVELEAAFGAGTLELGPALGGVEVAGLDCFEALLGGKRLSAGPDQHDVAGAGHDGVGGTDGVAYAGDARHGTGRSRGAAHDRGVELVAAIRGEDGAPAGVEERAILERDDSGDDGIDGRAAAGQYLLAGAEGGREGIAVGALLPRRHSGAVDGAGAAVDDEHGLAG